MTRQQTVQERNMPSVYRGIAEELREHPERWTQTFFAVDSTRRPVSPTNAQAVKWSGVGFCDRERVPYHPIISYGKAKWPTFLTLSAWEDKFGRTAAEVADLFEDVADVLEGDQP